MPKKAAKKTAKKVVKKTAKKSTTKKSTTKKTKKVCGPHGSKTSYTKAELNALAKKKGVKGFSTMTRPDLCHALGLKYVAAKSKVGKGKGKGKGKGAKRAKTPPVYTKPAAAKKAKVAKAKAKVAKAKRAKVEVASAADKFKALKTPARFKSSLNLNVPCIAKSKLPLREHQKLVAAASMKQRGIVAAHQVGSGKTLTAVTVAACHLSADPKNHVIVVTPVSLMDNFKKEVIAYGMKPSSRMEFYTTVKFANTFQNKKLPANTLLIVDEAHSLRTKVPVRATAKTTRSSIFVDKAKEAAKVLLLTGSLIYNDPYDVANLVAMAKGEDPMTQRQFDQLISPGNEESFRRYFSCVISTFYTDKAVDYPSVEEKEVFIDMTPSYLKEYQKLENMQGPYNKADPWAFLTGLRTASNELVECLKCQPVLEIVKKSPKTVIYSSFVAKGIKVLQKLLKEAGIKYEEISGTTHKKDRGVIVQRYNNDEFPVLFITKAGGEGLDLKGVRAVILFESTWNRQSEEQVIGRACRYKSHNHLPLDQQNVTVYKLLVRKPGDIPLKDQSADLLLREFIHKKEVKNVAFLKRIQKYSLESKYC